MHLKISRGHGFLGFVLQAGLGITHAMVTGGGEIEYLLEEEERKLMEELEESENLSKGSSHEAGPDETNGSSKEEEDGGCDTDYSPEEDCDEQGNETETGDEEEEEKEKEEDEGGDLRVATMENLGNYSEKLQKALIGDLDDDFPESVKVVRIFTSSTFTGKLFELESGNGSLELLTLLL